MSQEELESMAARSARALTAARAVEDSDRADAALQELGTAMEYLLECCVKWPSQGWWCDGVLVHEVTALSETEVAIAGVAGYGPGGWEWFAPIEAEFALDIGQDSLRSYTIRFGTKECDDSLAKVPSNPSASFRDRLLKRRPRQPEDWWFTYHRP